MCVPKRKNIETSLTIRSEYIDDTQKIIGEVNNHHKLFMKALSELHQGSGEIHLKVLEMTHRHLKSCKFDVVKIGEKLINNGVDNFCSGGFWIWNISNGIEYYSPNFIHSLGFNDEYEFPYKVESWQNQITEDSLKIALDNYQKHIDTKGKHPYYQIVDYYKKNGEMIKTICSGSVLFKAGEPHIMVGTHDLADEKKTHIS